MNVLTYTTQHISTSIYCGFFSFFFLLFLCQLTCQSADIMSSLCGVGVHVYMNNFSLKTTRPRDMLFILKDTLNNCARHADLFVRLFPRANTSEVPPPKVWKFQHFITIFSFTIAGIFLLHICTRPLVDSLV